MPHLSLEKFFNLIFTYFFCYFLLNKNYQEETTIIIPHFKFIVSILLLYNLFRTNILNEWALNCYFLKNHNFFINLIFIKNLNDAFLNLAHFSCQPNTAFHFSLFQCPSLNNTLFKFWFIFSSCLTFSILKNRNVFKFTNAFA